MAKQKKLTYLLIAALAMIWGIVFFRIYAATAKEAAAIVPFKEEKMKYFNLVNHENDTVILKLNYDNPFRALGQETVAEVPDEKIVLPAVHLPLTIKPSANWNAISYTGYINNAKNKKKIAVLSINGVTITLNVGEGACGLKLLQFAGDSVKVAYQNEVKYLKLK
jgi:hypothetical protein